MSDEFFIDPPDNIPNWENVLGKDADPGRLYVVPNKPGAVAAKVAEAVFKVLTDEDLIDRASESLAAGAPTETEEMTILQMTKEDYLRREGNKFAKELEEALDQGEKASQADLSKGPSRVFLDNWEGTAVKAEISIEQLEDNSDFIILKAPVGKLGEDEGFPSTLVEREFTIDSPVSEEEDERVKSVYDQSLDRLAKMGFDRDDVDRRIRNSLANGGSVCSVVSELEHNGQKAIMSTDVTVEGQQVLTNPETGEKEVDFSGVQWISVQMNVEPIITPESRHDYLLAIREIALGISEDDDSS